VSSAAAELIMNGEGIPSGFLGMSESGTNFFGYFLFSQKKVTRPSRAKPMISNLENKEKNNKASATLTITLQLSH
jgi:hypothetical protein